MRIECLEQNGNKLVYKYVIEDRLYFVVRVNGTLHTVCMKDVVQSPYIRSVR